MKPRIKIKFLDFWQDITIDSDFLILNLLKKHYEVEICDNPDYVFFSVMGDDHWSVPPSCVKIFVTGECLCPDFNTCDYAIGFDRIDFGCRYLRFPLYLMYRREKLLLCQTKHIIPNNWSIIDNKKSFCSFTVSNSGNPIRNAFFEKLSSYKKVDSGGKLMNNIGGAVLDKLQFDSEHKFSIAFENCSYPGYTTEKLVEAFAARTIPIYWGDPQVDFVFNERAFINASKFDSFDTLIEEIKRIDQDDSLYLSMLKEPALRIDANSFEEEHLKLEVFLQNIFKMPLEKAKQYNRKIMGKKYIDEMRVKADLFKKMNEGQLSLQYQVLKKLGLK